MNTNPDTSAPVRVEPLTPAEQAMLQCWHEHVRSYSPNLRRYNPEVHLLRRKLLYYLMTEDLIEYYKQQGVPQYSATALDRMGIRPSTLKVWRDQWGRTWRKYGCSRIFRFSKNIVE